MVHPPPTATKFIPGRETGQLRLSQPGMKTGYFPALRLSSSGAFLPGCCLGRRMCRARQVCAGPEPLLEASEEPPLCWGEAGRGPWETAGFPLQTGTERIAPSGCWPQVIQPDSTQRVSLRGDIKQKSTPALLAASRDNRQPLLSCNFFEA